MSRRQPRAMSGTETGKEVEADPIKVTPQNLDEVLKILRQVLDEEERT